MTVSTHLAIVLHLRKDKRFSFKFLVGLIKDHLAIQKKKNQMENESFKEADFKTNMEMDFHGKMKIQL